MIIEKWRSLTKEAPALPPQEKEHEMILEDLKKTKTELEIAYSGFDNVTEPDLIDCYIYKVNAVLKRYKFLMEKAASLEENAQELEL